MLTHSLTHIHTTDTRRRTSLLTTGAVLLLRQKVVERLVAVIFCFHTYTCCIPPTPSCVCSLRLNFCLVSSSSSSSSPLAELNYFSLARPLISAVQHGFRDLLLARPASTIRERVIKLQDTYTLTYLHSRTLTPKKRLWTCFLLLIYIVRLITVKSGLPSLALSRSLAPVCCVC